jgi:CheY-like chemotaxis protein
LECLAALLVPHPKFKAPRDETRMESCSMSAPYKSAPAGSGNEAEETTWTPPRSSRVLIVDDEFSARKVLAVMLAQFPFLCTTAATGDEALQNLEIELFDAVISDLQMPGISGMELLVEVRRRYPYVAFLVATGVDQIRVGVQAMQQGADDYLVKPFDLEIVVSSLHRALQKNSWNGKWTTTASTWRKWSPNELSSCEPLCSRPSAGTRTLWKHWARPSIFVMAPQVDIRAAFSCTRWELLRQWAA